MGLFVRDARLCRLAGCGTNQPRSCDLAAVGKKGPALALVATVWPRPVLFGSACSSSVPLCGRSPPLRPRRSPLPTSRLQACTLRGYARLPRCRLCRGLRWRSWPLCGLTPSCLGPPAPLQSLFAADRRLFVRDARLCRQAGCRPARCGGMRGSLAAVCVGASAGARGRCVASPCPVWVRLLLFSPSLRLIAASSSATLASADKPVAGHAAGVCEAPSL